MKRDGEPLLVKELIERLQQMDSNKPVYVETIDDSINPVRDVEEHGDHVLIEGY